MSMAECHNKRLKCLVHCPCCQLCRLACILRTALVLRLFSHAIDRSYRILYLLFKHPQNNCIKSVILMWAAGPATPLKRAPAWLKRPSGVAFGFGGRLVSFKNTPRQGHAGEHVEAGIVTLSHVSSGLQDPILTPTATIWARLSSNRTQVYVT